MPQRTRRLPMDEIVVGNDQTITIPLWNSDGTALSVSGYTAEWNLYRAGRRNRRSRKPFRGTAVLTKTSAAGQITLSDGSAAIVVANSDLANKSGDFWQVLELTDGSSNIARHGEGPVLARAAAP